MSPTTRKTPPPTTRPGAGPKRSNSREAGFTLIEAIVATAVLVVGMAGVTNLMVVAISANSLGNRTTMASFVASQKMEELRSIPFDDPRFADSPFPSANTTSLDVDVDNYNGQTYNEDVTVDGAGTYHTRWSIRTVVAYGQSLKYLAVRTEAVAPMGRLTRAEFTTLRACTLTGCAP